VLGYIGCGGLDGPRNERCLPVKAHNKTTSGSGADREAGGLGGYEASADSILFARFIGPKDVPEINSSPLQIDKPSTRKYKQHTTTF
jgi:hypothetical protein